MFSWSDIGFLKSIKYGTIQRVKNINFPLIMAKKSKRGRPRKQTVVQEESIFSLSSETKKSVLVIGLLCLAILMFLSMFNLAGQFGVVLVKGMKILFGVGYAAIPVLMAALGVLLIHPERYHFTGMNYLGIGLFVLGYTGLFHVSIPIEESGSVILAAEQGGGYVGWFASYVLLRIMDFWATLVLLIGLLVIGIFLTFNISLHAIRSTGNQTANVWARLTSWVFNKDLAEEVFEDEDDDSEQVYEDEEALYDDGDEAEEVVDDAEEVGAATSSPSVPAAAASAVLEGAKVLTAEEHVDIQLPPRLLKNTSSKPTSGDIDSVKEKIRRTFEQFNIDVDMGEVSIGPTVTQYTLKPAEGVKLAKIVGLTNDLALALAAHPIRIEAPIPGKSLVGIEVPNQGIATVSLREVVDSKDFVTCSAALPMGLGKDVAGKVWTIGLDTLPHLLIAGATGSGKSVCINTLIVSLLYANNPDELKFIMVDPKRVELSLYNGIPYLLTPVITDPQKTINALRWSVGEMDQRYQALAAVGKRNIVDYNTAYPDKKLPYIVLIIDELADLMAVASQEVEGAIVRLAQMARAVGIHLVLATQRPSVDVITGLIKANVTSRIAFAVASQTDSRTILDTSGAEKLLGRGDMLITTPKLTKPKRLQGAFLSDEEINRVTDYIKKQVKDVTYHDEIIKPKQSTGLPGSSGDDADPLLLEARRQVIEAGKASASYLQRRLRIGYSRAARLLDFLEEEGTIGPSEGSKPREVLVGPEALAVEEEFSPEELLTTEQVLSTEQLGDEDEDESEDDEGHYDSEYEDDDGLDSEDEAAYEDDEEIIR